jgi:hypothetical protein
MKLSNLLAMENGSETVTFVFVLKTVCSFLKGTFFEAEIHSTEVDNALEVNAVWKEEEKSKYKQKNGLPP